MSLKTWEETYRTHNLRANSCGAHLFDTLGYQWTMSPRILQQRAGGLVFACSIVGGSVQCRSTIAHDDCPCLGARITANIV